MQNLLSLLCAALLLCLLVTTTKAQDNDQRARSAYLNAEDYFNQGKYADAANNLYKAKEYLGSTNPKIQYLLVKSLYSGTYYSRAKTELSEYLRLVQGNEDDEGPKYAEMLKLVDRIDGLIAQKELQDRQKREQQEVEVRQRREQQAVAAQQERERVQAIQEQNRIRESRLQEQQRVEAEYNRKRSIIGTWSGKVRSPGPLGFADEVVISINAEEIAVSLKKGIDFEFSYFVTEKEFPLNSARLCKAISGVMKVKQTSGSRSKEVLSLPCKIYTTNEQSPNLILEFQDYETKEPLERFLSFRAKFVLKNENIKVPFMRLSY